MGHRLSKITTRTGDDGTTGLGDGSRVNKDDPRVEAMGAVDELNSAVGVLLTESLPDDVRAHLLEIQHTLFDLGGELSIPGYALLKDSQVTDLEESLVEYNENLAPLKDFILPGGTRASATCHVARSLCRRAERRVVSMGKTDQPPPIAGRYLNRLSDWLFVVARYLNHSAGENDIIWKRD